MKLDPITEEELWRSVVVYFVSFLIVGTLDYEGYVSVGGFETFIWAFVLTAVHFVFMVRYRKKENLTNPSISYIIDHLLHPEKPEGKNGMHPESGQNFRLILTILTLAYLIYRYAV